MEETRDKQGKSRDVLSSTLIKTKKEVSALQSNPCNNNFFVVEFFTYGKVATQKLPESKLLGSPSKAAIKRYQDNKQKHSK